ncbi:SIS domain-containing protein [Yoonia sp. 208BN28-4]|uniref:SIS domain-containing protein n=1 Tax=Yoonia sp. 208BN28-4 TaxID=3126505 RepID=UPI0030A43FE7
MPTDNPAPGQHMAAEAAEALAVFCKAATKDIRLDAKQPTAIFTIARGSSDAAANILSYEFMRELQIPVTSLPPSVFSLGDGVSLNGAAAMIVSQSGASDDLVQSAKGARAGGAAVVAITNHTDSPVQAQSDVTIPIGAGQENAVPATKTVTGSIGAGMALLAAFKPGYRDKIAGAVDQLRGANVTHPDAHDLRAALLRARHVYVIGRDTAFGAAHEIALKLKECCAIHAEAYSSSEVLHGPLQLATNPLMVLILDNGAPWVQDSLDEAEARFRQVDCDVHRISPADLGLPQLLPPAAAAVLLASLYPVILQTALALGLDPDAPETLSKVTQTT